jgi:hypothetical protein
MYNKDNIFLYTLTTINAFNNFTSVKNGLIDKYKSPWNLFYGAKHSELDNVDELIISSYGVNYFQPFSTAKRKNIILVDYQFYLYMKNNNKIKNIYYNGNNIQSDYYHDIRNLYFEDFITSLTYCVKITYHLKTNVISEYEWNTSVFQQEITI